MVGPRRLVPYIIIRGYSIVFNWPACRCPILLYGGIVLSSTGPRVALPVPLALPFQILMHDVDELLGGGDLRRIARLAWIDHVLANVVFNDLRDKAVQGAATGGGLLQYGGAFVIRIDGAFDRFDLTTHALETIQELGFFFCDVAHNCLDSYCIAILG